MRTHICFHGIGRCVREREAGEARYWTTEKVFLELLDGLTEHPTVVLSFDDGNRSDAEIALPALRERGLSATFFVLAGRLDDPASLGPADLRELRTAGMWIGNHGWTHVPWTGLSPSDAEREMSQARRALAEASGGAVTEAALPLGRYDRTVLRRLRKADYRAVYTSDRFPARDAGWLRARYSVTAADTASSALSIVSGRPGLREARNIIASGVKRLR